LTGHQPFEPLARGRHHPPSAQVAEMAFDGGDIRRVQPGGGHDLAVLVAQAGIDALRIEQPKGPAHAQIETHGFGDVEVGGKFFDGGNAIELGGMLGDHATHDGVELCGVEQRCIRRQHDDLLEGGIELHGKTARTIRTRCFQAQKNMTPIAARGKAPRHASAPVIHSSATDEMVSEGHVCALLCDMLVSQGCAQLPSWGDFAVISSGWG
jgi:hypothetical protein